MDAGGGPASLPSFVNDVAEAFGEFVNQQSYKYAAGEGAAYPLVAPEGGKEPLMADFADFTMGSDHEVYADSSFGIPAISLTANDNMIERALEGFAAVIK